MYCEDYPACGHTPEDPCEPQWYDAPDAFDTRGNPHALCDHENGECDVWEDDEPDEEPEEWADDAYAMEDQWLDSYMEDRLSTMFEG